MKLNIASDSHRPGGAGDVPVPAELAGHVDPDHRGAGSAAGYVRCAGRVRLFDQYADHVRAGAGHRPAGGRCHRGGGERGAGDDLRRAGPEAGHAEGHGPDHRRAGRHRAGVDCSVPADGVLQRCHRRDLSAVLGDDCCGDDPVGAGGDDHYAGPVRQHPAPDSQGRASARRPRRRTEPAGQVLHLVQPPLRAHLQRPASPCGWFPWPAHAGRGVLPGAERGHRLAAVAPAGCVPAR
ncbi:hypothetical protein G6F66_013629 [Rhizopus arrhizus]|nr:hypothetical protein G6F66_013629 [Rhizopus arrhizus]